MWLKSLEIALAQRDIEALDTLLREPLTPQMFETLDEMKKAQFLLLEAAKIITELKDQSRATMIQLKKNIDFMRVSEQKSPNRFDIRS